MVKDRVKKIIPESLILMLWHKPRAIAAAWITGFPGKKMYCIAVAGTKGKTSTSFILNQFLQKNGIKTALFSTAALSIGDQSLLNPWKMTTPSPFILQLFLLRALKNNCMHVIIEVSSHALKQHRTFGIPFQMVVLTNLTPDHLDYHESAEEYISIHQKLITSATEHIIVNADDPFSKQFCTKKNSMVFSSHDHIGTMIDAPENPWWLSLQKINIIAAGVAAHALSLSNASLVQFCKTLLPPPGRFENIDEGQSFRVVVDYAHSPESLEYFFKKMRPLTKKRLIAVFGACGDRDKKTRPAMGALLHAFADIIILTTDDPYSEKPENIARDVMQGIPREKNSNTFFIIAERKEAIARAIDLAQKDDCICILGKGAEQLQIFADKKITWDDRKIARDILKTRGQA